MAIATRFNTRTTEIDARNRGFYIEFAPYAFTQATGVNVRMLREHDWGNLLGRVGSATLRFWQTGGGLFYEVAMPDTALAGDTLAPIRRGDLSEVSVYFDTKQDKWARTPDGERIHRIERAGLHEVSFVSRAAVPDTSVTIAESRPLSQETPDVQRIVAPAASGRNIADLRRELDARFLPTPTSGRHPSNLRKRLELTAKAWN